MKVMVIGSGGREHCLVWKLSGSSDVSGIIAVPGNAGIEAHATCISADINNNEELVKIAKDNKVALTIVGPEAPLVSGIVDKFHANGLKIFGPSSASARLEGSKIFAKEFMSRYGIPTARFEVFDSVAQAHKYIDSCFGKDMQGIVVKADGLAAGKGALVCSSQDEAHDAVEKIMVEKTFGSAGEKVVIEEKLEGEECSLMAFVDGKTLLPLLPSQDHKRAFDGDRGPNTGGMGAYAPYPYIDLDLIDREVSRRFLDGIEKEGLDYKGIIYFGLMLTSEGPKVLEFNVRFGDPETQAVLPLLTTDFLDIIVRTTEGRLSGMGLDWQGAKAVTVVIASSGYPGHYEKGKAITGLEEVAKEKGVVAFHAGTKYNAERNVATSGGRVLDVTALDSTLAGAISKVYQAVGKIHFDGAFYRTDIASKALKRER